MITDEELRKMQSYAKQTAEEIHRGVTITLAMDPVKLFSMTTELLRLRKLQVLFEDTWEESRHDAG